MENINSHEEYIEHCLKVANKSLHGMNTIEEVKDNEDRINVYENIDEIEDPNNIAILDGISREDYERAIRVILNGKFFSEHTAAGEATRLKLGTKYLIDIKNDLTPEKIATAISAEKGDETTSEDVVNMAGNRPGDLLSINLGTRHMIQYSFEISKLAEKYGYMPEEVLKKQKMLVVLNEHTADRIIKEFSESSYFGFKRENIFFMIQKAYHGISVDNNKFFYDKSTPKRLHNHGQMVLQQTFDKEIFYIDAEGKKRHIKAEEYGEVLKSMEDKISYNIEDLSYLTGCIDFESLAFALKKSDEGYAMLMEIVANNPNSPQKGGMAAYDKKIGRNVMIEGFQLKGIKNSEITYLNKNFNHYPKPYKCWSMLKNKGLNMPITVKDGAIYFQPVQGDINFLVKTEFFQRKELQPIKAWKSPSTTPLAIKYMKMQEQQKGFKEYAEKIIGKKLH